MAKKKARIAAQKTILVASAAVQVFGAITGESVAVRLSETKKQGE